MHNISEHSSHYEVHAFDKALEVASDVIEICVFTLTLPIYLFIYLFTLQPFLFLRWEILGANIHTFTVHWYLAKTWNRKSWHIFTVIIFEIFQYFLLYLFMLHNFLALETVTSLWFRYIFCSIGRFLCCSNIFPFNFIIFFLFLFR